MLRVQRVNGLTKPFHIFWPFQSFIFFIISSFCHLKLLTLKLSVLLLSSIKVTLIGFSLDSLLKTIYRYFFLILKFLDDEGYTNLAGDTLREEIIAEEFPAEEKFAELKIANLVEIRNLLFRNLWKMFAIRNLLFRNSWKMFVIRKLLLYHA